MIQRKSTPRSHQKPLSGYALRDAGWNALVTSLGLVNATRFILQYESGYSEYAKIKQELFKGKSVDDISKEIERFEKSGNRRLHGND